MFCNKYYSITTFSLQIYVLCCNSVSEIFHFDYKSCCYVTKNRLHWFTFLLSTLSVETVDNFVNNYKMYTFYSQFVHNSFLLLLYANLFPVIYNNYVYRTIVR